MLLAKNRVLEDVSEKLFSTAGATISATFSSSLR